MKEFSDVFQESLPGLPPHREIKHKIGFIGTLTEIAINLQIIPLEDENLKKHLSEAMVKSFFRVFKSPFGVAVFFV